MVLFMSTEKYFHLLAKNCETATTQWIKWESKDRSVFWIVISTEWMKLDGTKKGKPGFPFRSAKIKTQGKILKTQGKNIKNSRKKY